MKVDKLLSLIIPVYNSELYLRDCLNSVFGQFQDWLEVIIVNDGSTDSSYEIIECFSRENDFVLIDQVNCGVATARNAGLNAANGEYIAFLDSDDIWCDDTANIIYDLLKNNKVDCFTFNYNELLSDKTIRDVKLNVTNVNTLTDGNLDSHKNELARDSQWFLWRFILNNKCYKNIRFDDNRRFEDQLILPTILNSVSSLVNSTHAIIEYRQVDSSITKNLKPSDLVDSEFCISRYVEKYSSSRSNFWAKTIANIYVSHVSKCARIYHSDPNLSLDSYNKVNSFVSKTAIIQSVNIKAIIYLIAKEIMLKRLVKSVRNEV